MSFQILLVLRSLPFCQEESISSKGSPFWLLTAVLSIKFSADNVFLVFKLSSISLLTWLTISCFSFGLNV